MAPEEIEDEDLQTVIEAMDLPSTRFGTTLPRLWERGTEFAKEQALQVGEGVRRAGGWVEGQAKEFAEDPGGYYTEKIYPPGRIAGAVERMDEGESFSEATGAQGVLAAASLADPTLASDVGSATLYMLEGDTESARNALMWAAGGFGAGALAAKLLRMRKIAKAKALANGASPAEADRVADELVEIASKKWETPGGRASEAERLRDWRRANLSEGEYQAQTLSDWVDSPPGTPLPAGMDPDLAESARLLKDMDPDPNLAKGDEFLRSYEDPTGAGRPYGYEGWRGARGGSEDIYERARRVEPGPGQRRMDVDYEPPELGHSRTPGGDWPPGMEYEQFVGGDPEGLLRQSMSMRAGGRTIVPPPASTKKTLRVMESPERYWKSERARVEERLRAHRARGGAGDPAVESQLMQDLEEIDEALWELGPHHPYPNPYGPGTSLKAPIDEIPARQRWLSRHPSDEAMADVLRSQSGGSGARAAAEWVREAPIEDVRRFVDNLDEVSGMQDSAAKARVLIRELADTNPRDAEDALRKLATEFEGDSPTFDIIPWLEKKLGRPRGYANGPEVAAAAKRFKKK
jgi:hypothetical protein